MKVFRYAYHKLVSGSNPVRMRFNTLFAVFCFSVISAVGPSRAAVRVLFLPFEDKVKLNEAWNLAVDVPRWFSQTIDTIGSSDTLVRTIPFDTISAFLARSGWNRGEYLAAEKMQRMAATFHADLVATGTVRKFVVVKRAFNGDGSVDGASSFSGATSGDGGVTLMAGLQSYTADARITVTLYSGQTGAVVGSLSLDARQKDGGIKIWLPTQTETDEMNFYYLSRTPFGSEYFHKSVIGALMKSYSQRLRDAVKAQAATLAVKPAGPPRQFLQAKILERSGKDIYLNAGSADNLVLGDTLEVLKPQKPVIQGADTLGWVETPVATALVRSIKANHFSVATIITEQDSVPAGWTVRTKITP